MEIGFRWRYDDGSCVCRGIENHIGIVDFKFRWKKICVPILLFVSLYSISVTKLWDMIIPLCMCKGQTHHPKGIKSKSGCKMAKTFNFGLQVTVKWESNRYIRDEIYKQHLSDWCHGSHWRSCPCPIRICLNDDHYAACIHASNCPTLQTDLVPMVEIIEIAYGMSWKSRRRGWMRKGEELELYLPKTSEMIYMP